MGSAAKKQKKTTMKSTKWTINQLLTVIENLNETAKNTDVEIAKWKKVNSSKKQFLNMKKKEYELDDI